MKSELLNVGAKITWHRQGLAAFRGVGRWVVRIEADYYLWGLKLFFLPPAPPLTLWGQINLLNSKNTFLRVCMVYQTFRLYSPAPRHLFSTIEVLSCHFWSPVTGWGVGSSISSSPHYFKKLYIPRKFAGAPVGRLCWGTCKAGWRNQLFLSTKCIRWKVEWPKHDVSSFIGNMDCC